MMKRWKKGLTLMLAIVLCLSFAACGGADDDIAGDDWRTSGIVAGSGTITHDGDSVDVLVTVSETSAAFYRDLPEQILFDSVLFPMTVPNAEQAFNAISFNDMDGDGESDVLVSFIHENGDITELIWIWDPVERYVFREDLSTVTVSGDSDGDGSYLDDYVGLWEYQGENLWLRIHDDATWEFVNDQEDVLDSGALWPEEDCVTLHYEGSGDVLRLDRTGNGDLTDASTGGILFPVEAIESSTPYFPRYGLELNGLVDMGTFLLEDGACVFSGLGNEYRLADVYWEIVQNGDYTHDGIRELHFDAICYVPEGTVTGAQGESLVVSSELYDGYSGMWLTTATTYNDSPRGDNYYLHTVEWKGSSYLIEFSYSKDWQYNVGDWDMVLTKSYAVYIPEDYDGLFFAAETQPDNYPDCAKRMQMDSISPEAAILDIDTLDPYSSLYFSLCF